MKNLFFIVVFFCFLFLGCKTDSEKYERDTLECWGKKWLSVSDTSGKMLEKGILSLDSFLLEKGYLGKGLPSDYIRFINDTQEIIIDEDVTNYKWLYLALMHDNSDGVNINGCFDCIKNNIIAHLNKLDSSDALFKFGKTFERCESGEIKAYPFIELYSGFTKDELQRPFIKSMFYTWAPNLTRIHFQKIPLIKQGSISLPVISEDSIKTEK